MKNHQNAKRAALYLFQALLVVSLIGLASCGEMFQQEWPDDLKDFDPDKQPTLSGLGVDKDYSLTLYVGEEHELDPKVTIPDVGEFSLSDLDEDKREVALSRIYAKAGNGDSIVRVRQVAITAMGVGTDVITFSDSEGKWTAKLPVFVKPVWMEKWAKWRSTGWRYETIVYADVTVNDEPVSADVKLVALCGNQMRGRGVTQTVKVKGEDMTYTVFRIGSNTASGETITFEGYDTKDGQPVVIKETITFDGATHGTLSKLEKLQGTK